MASLKIVARYRDGRVLKGTTENFNPTAGGFHLSLVPKPADGRPVSIRLSDLKAIFIVRDYQGSPQHIDGKSFENTATATGARLRITFSDGEVLVGHTHNYDPIGPGFFLFPADASGNNQRIYVINGAVKAVEKVA